MKDVSWAFEGDDVLMRSILRDRTSPGSYFDIGASHPIENSNTYYFYNKGWRGLAVDARDLHFLWSEYRPQDVYQCTLVGSKDESVEYWIFPDACGNTFDRPTAERYASRYCSSDVTSETRVVRNTYSAWVDYNNNFERPELMAPDFVSIDVEGSECDVIEGLLGTNRNFRPPALLVEAKLFNFIRPLDNEIVRLLVNFYGYSLIAKTPLNAYFIDPANALFNWIPRQMIEY
jgi:hypothetical protein